MRDIEEKLNEWLNVKAPYHLPAATKEGLVKALPWVSVIGGLLMLYLAYWAWQAVGYVNELSAYLGVMGVASPMNSPMMWVSLAILVAEAVLMFMAYPGLAAKQKRGWNLLYWAIALNVVVGVAQLFTTGYGLGNFLGYLLGSVVSLYLLFQVRSFYTGGASTPSKPADNSAKPADTPPTPPTPPADTTPPAETPTNEG